MGGGRIRDQLGGYCSSPGRDGKAVGETWDSFWRLIGTCFFVLFLFVVVVFIFGHTARECRILVPGPGMEPPPRSPPPAVEAQSLNHWTAREVPQWDLLIE